MLHTGLRASTQATFNGTDPSWPGRVGLVDEAAFRAAMRRLAGAVCIIATGEPGSRAGLTATAVCSITADPPRLLVCINRKTQAHASFAANGRLSVNVLASDAERLAKRFAGMVAQAHGEDRFSEGAWSQLAAVPVLADACAAFACQIAETIPAGTHSMFLCDVVAVHVPHGTGSQVKDGLLYLDGHFRHLAPVSGSEVPSLEWIW